MRAFYVYILRCADGAFYVGHTDDLGKRMAEHEEGVCCRYTRKRRPVELAYFDAFDSRAEVLEKERQLKGWSRAKKEALIRGEWAELRRLSRKRCKTG